MLCEFGAGRRAETARTLLTGFLPYSILHRLWLRNISVVLATNSDTMKLAKAMGRPQVEPWFDAALPVDFFADKPRTFSGTSEPLRLLWVGRMVPRKALPLTLDMLSRVRCRTTLTIVGDGLPEPQVRNLIAERGLSDRVSWAGRRLNRAEMRNAYAEHDVLICPSLRDSCPPQLVEAMGSGLPVIVLDHHGARDLVPDGAGIKVPVTTRDRVVNDLAAAVDQYAAFSNAERSAMSNIGWSFARTLNYRDGAELFEALYRQVLEGSSVLTAFPLTEQHSRMKLSLRR
jgi:glycosyltransferase involved in cell wall biosynthesis